MNSQAISDQPQKVLLKEGYETTAFLLHPTNLPWATSAWARIEPLHGMTGKKILDYQRDHLAAPAIPNLYHDMETC